MGGPQSVECLSARRRGDMSVEDENEDVDMQM